MIVDAISVFVALFGLALALHWVLPEKDSAPRIVAGVTILFLSHLTRSLRLLVSGMIDGLTRRGK